MHNKILFACDFYHERIKKWPAWGHANITHWMPINDPGDEHDSEDPKIAA